MLLSLCQAVEKASLELTLDKAKELKLTSKGSVEDLLARVEAEPKGAKEMEKTWAAKVASAGD